MATFLTVVTSPTLTMLHGKRSQQKVRSNLIRAVLTHHVLAGHRTEMPREGPAQAARGRQSIAPTAENACELRRQCLTRRASRESDIAQSVMPALWAVWAAPQERNAAGRKLSATGERKSPAKRALSSVRMRSQTAAKVNSRRRRGSTRKLHGATRNHGEGIRGLAAVTSRSRTSGSPSITVMPAHRAIREDC